MYVLLYDSLPEVQGMENLELLQLFQPVIFKIVRQSELQNCFVIGRSTKANVPEEAHID